MKSSKNETGYVTILYSVGQKPLQNWDLTVKNGHIKRVIDPEIESAVIEIVGANINQNVIATPANIEASLGIRMPLIVLLVKNVYIFFIAAEKVLRLRSDSTGRQKSEKSLQSHKLSSKCL